jgi:hypothetical protein
MIRLALPFFVLLLLASPALALPMRFELRVTGNVAQIDLEPVGTPLGGLIGESVETVFQFEASEATTGVNYNPAAPSSLAVTSSFLSFVSSNATQSGLPVWPLEKDLEVRFEDNGFDEIRVLGIAPLATGVFDPFDEVTGAILILTASGGGAYTGIPQDTGLGLSDFDSATLILFGSEQQEFLGPDVFEDNWVLQVSLTGLSLSAVPEPGAAALLGLAGLALARRFHR